MDVESIDVMLSDVIAVVGGHARAAAGARYDLSELRVTSDCPEACLCRDGLHPVGITPTLRERPETSLFLGRKGLNLYFDRSTWRRTWIGRPEALFTIPHDVRKCLDYICSPERLRG